jgi:hypothetical protein
MQALPNLVVELVIGTKCSKKPAAMEDKNAVTKWVKNVSFSPFFRGCHAISAMQNLSVQCRPTITIL